jgi:methylmalonyl-CoA mutase
MTDALDDPLALAAGFPPADEAAWRALAAKAAKGASLDSLKTSTYDGFSVDPLARRRADAAPLATRESGDWQVVCRIDGPNPDAALAQAHDELNNGATGLSLVYPGSAGAHGFALDRGGETLTRILDVLDPTVGVAVELDFGDTPDNDAVLATLKAVCATAQSGAIRIGSDPIGAMARAGGAAAHWQDRAQRWATDVIALAEAGFRGRAAAADGRIVHDAGGSEAQELAFVLSTGLAYLRALENSGMALAQARDFIFFRLAADAEFFLTIAKFRALRKLWAAIEHACGIAPTPAFISAQTAWRMQTRRDAETNIIRNTIATAAAGIGGANAVTVLPHTIALGRQDHFARRVARNTQWLLLAESHLTAVGDPAAGSGGLEALTDQLCAAAWQIFQDIEAQGGIATALERGTFQNAVAKVRKDREAALAARRDCLVGTTEYVLRDGTTAQVLADAPTSADLVGQAIARQVVTMTPLQPFRLATPYEAQHDAGAAS